MNLASPVAKCVYDVQLLAIWRISLLAVLLLLSLALRVGPLRRLPAPEPVFPVSEMTVWKEERWATLISFCSVASRAVMLAGGLLLLLLSDVPCEVHLKCFYIHRCQIGGRPDPPLYARVWLCETMWSYPSTAFTSIFSLHGSYMPECATNYRTNLFTNPVIPRDSSYSSCLWHK